MQGTEQATVTNQNIIQLESGVKIDITATKHSGRLTKVIYHNDTNHLCILKIGGVTCKGVLHKPLNNSLYNLTGKYVFDVKYNQHQFKFDRIERDVDDLQGIKEYLYREAPGLGMPTINKLLHKFQGSILSIMESDYSQLTTIPGITDQKAKTLHDWYCGQKSNAKIKEQLYEIGLLPAQVSKVIATYGNYAADQIRKDCFSLTDISGFGFVTVSKIADLVGIPKTDVGRIKAALLYAFNSLYDEGHVCFAVSQVVREAGALLSIDQKHIWPQVEVLVSGGKLIREDYDYEQYCNENGILI